jgi:hypothetical protein
MIDEDFRTLLLTLMPAATPIEKGNISMEQLPTRVYYELSGGNREVLQGGALGMQETVFDIEVAAIDEDNTQDLMDRIKNGVVRTTLDGAVNSSVASITLDDASGLPTNKAFVITIDSEDMKVTAISSSVATVTRGYNGTTAANHANNANVSIHGLNGFRGEFGNTTALGVFLEDHSDNYQPRFLDEDDGYRVATVQALVLS